MPFDSEKQTHPSWGKIAIHRITGGARSLFGSSINHGETIRITISEASPKRDLHHDWIHEEGQLIEVEMSPVQFAEMLTNMQSTGTPCTLLYIRGEKVPKCEYSDKKELFKNEFKNKVARIAECMDEMGEVLGELKTAKSIKKSDVDRLSGMFARVHQDIVSNMPFAAEMFDEHMERTTLEAKGEIEAYLLHRALRMAEEGMKLVTQLDKPEDRPQFQLD